MGHGVRINVCCLIQVDLQRARRNFELWYGGVPRLVVELPSTEDDESEDKRLAMDAINATSIEQVCRVARRGHVQSVDANTFCISYCV